jgi:5-methylcytosine-specific restriction endonuclease McrA
MPNKLRAKEICPLHRRRDCCGRSEFNRYTQPRHELKYKVIRPGVKLYPDGREVCSPAELKRRKDYLLLAWNPHCVACGEAFTDYAAVELAHKKSKGMGGSRRRDNWDNLVLMCVGCNRDQGSMDLDEYLEKVAQ